MKKLLAIVVLGLFIASQAQAKVKSKDINFANDFYVSSILLSKPNFITSKSINGSLIFLDGKSKKNNLKNKIVVIENADPGFDWIFSHKIKGLITKFGGINSHMSIRCEELNLPAIIGFGEDNYLKIVNKKIININCGLQKISYEE